MVATVCITRTGYNLESSYWSKLIFISQEAPFIPLSNDVNFFRNKEIEGEKIEKNVFKINVLNVQNIL